MYSTYVYVRLLKDYDEKLYSIELRTFHKSLFVVELCKQKIKVLQKENRILLVVLQIR